MAEDQANGTAAAGLVRRRAGLRHAGLFRRALTSLGVLAMVAILNMASAGLARADCGDQGLGVCPNGMCAPVGASCCPDGGHYCDPGNECYAAASGNNFCCQASDIGFADGGCAPNGTTPLSYCGNSRYCENPDDTCWTVLVSTGTCCPLGTQPEPDGYCAPVGTSPANYCGAGTYCSDANTRCCNDNSACCQ
jgi:hypothetical protein